MLRALGLALALTCAASPAAHAADLFETYQAMCVQPRADAGKALAQADADGWMPIPAAMMGDLAKTGITDASGRLRSDSTGMRLMFVGRQTQKIENETMNLSMCAVAAMPGDYATLKAKAAAWAAVPLDKKLSKGAQVAYAFTDEGGVHQAVVNPSDNEAKALVRSGRINFVFVSDQNGLAMIAFAVPTM